MEGDHADGYLAGLPAARAAELTAVNGPGLTALRRYLEPGGAVAFLGAGVSAPLYPLWDGLIGELVDAAAGRLEKPEAETCRTLARQSPEEVVEIIRQRLSVGSYREVLREVLRPRVDPESGRSWTPVQELVCRCPFKAVVTTNYDPGILDARTRVRPRALATGFTTWEDELGLDRWRNGDVFGEAELPVLFAHGQHNKPDSVVLATTEYRRAYAGKLPQVLARLLDGHLVWIGFSFADQRIAAILREISDRTGTRADPGGAPRHVAVMAWDPDAAGNDPRVLARQVEIAYGAEAVLYPAPGGDQSALGELLKGLVDDRFPAAAELPARTTAPAARLADAGPPVEWLPAPQPVEHFTGRAEELARLDRWAADPQVALVAVTAWGGAGKTALATHWVCQAGGPARRPGIRGVFGWSFYADPSAEHWAQALLNWAERELGFLVRGNDRPAAKVLTLLRAAPLMLVLDGLEVVQESAAGDDYGRLLDGTLREVLAGACQLRHGGLVLLTSRFPFADLETFDGDSARTLEVPPFTLAEGADLLAAAGGDWLSDGDRRELVQAVDGHALAVGVLAGLLAARPPAQDIATLRTALAMATRTNARVGNVLAFYAERLSEPDRYLLAAVSLFARPVAASAVLAVAAHEAFGGRLSGWTAAMVRDAVRDRLGGLASWHPDGTISTHPLVRDTFRSLVLDAAGAAAETALTGLPAGMVTSPADALRVAEAIELLLDADQWEPARDLYTNRCGNGVVWLALGAVRTGQRAAASFVATPVRRAACSERLGPGTVGHYLASVGLFAMYAGDMVTAREYLPEAVARGREESNVRNLAIRLRNLADCFGYLGQPAQATEAAAEALTNDRTEGHQDGISYSYGYLGYAAALAGDAADADRNFAAADQIEFAGSGVHLYSALGARWADWLARTGRATPAHKLASSNLDICQRNAWTDDTARCNRVLGCLALAAGDTVTAGKHLMAAAEAFRAGDFLTDLATTLGHLAEHARVAGDFATAEQRAAEAISIAAPRGLVPAHSAALAARARIRATQAVAMADPDLLFQGRDAAGAALRLAVRHHLAWHELDALRAHAALDKAEGADHGWAAQADVLHASLVPPDLDPDPLATVERMVAERMAANGDGAEGQ
jgi:tetratricopeptide (TPR) repeat protein